MWGLDSLKAANVGMSLTWLRPAALRGDFQVTKYSSKW